MFGYVGKIFIFSINLYFIEFLIGEELDIMDKIIWNILVVIQMMQKDFFVKSINLILQTNIYFLSIRFSDKTKNDFYYRDTFIKYPGKYDYVQLDYNPSVIELKLGGIYLEV